MSKKISELEKCEEINEDSSLPILCEGETMQLLYKTLVKDLKKIFSEFSGDYNDLENKPDLTKLITNEEVRTIIDNRINELVNGAPETFDTLKEIADYIAEHEEVAKALNEAIGNKADKEELEGLATEEYVDNKIGDIDTLLAKIADESEAI